jgi:hypothetical protein
MKVVKLETGAWVDIRTTMGDIAYHQPGASVVDISRARRVLRKLCYVPANQPMDDDRAYREIRALIGISCELDSVTDEEDETISDYFRHLRARVN